MIELLRWFLVIVFVYASWLTGSLVLDLFGIKKLLSKNSIFFLSMYLGFTAIELFFAHVSLWNVFPISTLSIVIVWIIGIFTIRQILLFQKKNFSFKPKLPSFEIVLLTCVSIGIMAWFQFRHDQILGGDTPYYLRMAGHWIDHGFAYKHFDRNIVHGFTVILQLLTGISLTSSLKLLSVMMFTLSVVGTATLSEKILGRKSVFLAGLITLTNPTILRLPLDILANNFAYLAMLAIFLILLEMINPKKLLAKLVLLFFVWATLFNLHGIIAVLSLVFVSIPLLFLAFFHRKKIRTQSLPYLAVLFFCIPLFIFLSMPFMKRPIELTWFYGIKPVIDTLTPPQEIQPQHINSIEAQAVSQNQKSFRKSLKGETAHFSDIPLNKDYFIEFNSSLTIFLSLIGLLVLVYQIRWQKQSQQEKNILLLLSFLFMGFAHQQLFGFDFYTLRIVQSMSYLIIIFATCGFLFLLTYADQFKSRLLLRSLLLLSLVSFQIPNIIRASNGYHEIYDQTKYDFLNSVSSFIAEEDALVLSYTSLPDLSEGLNYQKNIFLPPQSIVCDPDNEFHKIKNNWEYSAILSEETKLVDRKNVLTQVAYQHIYILYDTQKPCLASEFKDRKFVEEITANGRLKLVKVK